MSKTFRPLYVEKVCRLFQHEVNQWNKYGGKYVGDFVFLNFKQELTPFDIL